MMTEVIISDFHCDILPMWNFYRQKYWFGFVITTIAGFYLTLELTDNRWWMKSQSLVDDVSVSVFVWLCTIFAPSGAAGVCEHSSHTIWVVPNVRSGMENLTMGGLHHPAPIVEVVQEVCTTPGALCPGFNCKEREVATGQVIVKTMSSLSWRLRNWNGNSPVPSDAMKSWIIIPTHVLTSQVTFL